MASGALGFAGSSFFNGSCDVIISHSKKFIFVHIHKTGGSSLETAIAPSLAWNDLILGTTPLGAALNTPYFERYGLNDHSSVDDIAAICGPEIFDDYFSFALVRHPVDRAVSLYNYMYSMCNYHCLGQKMTLDQMRDLLLNGPEDDPLKQSLLSKYPYLDWTAMRSFLQSRSFGDFIRAPLTRSDTAFFPQSERVRSLDGKVVLSEYIKLEEINVHIRRLSAQLDLPLPFGRENASPYRLIEVPDVSLDDRQYLKQEFNEDFLAFEYD